MAKNKADLYKRSFPNEEKEVQKPSTLFKFMIGSWEKGRNVEIWGTSFTDAWNKAQDYLHKNDEIIEVWRDGKKCWDYYENLTP